MKNAIKHGVFLFLALAVLVFVSFKILLMDFPITNFDNLILGVATARNIDISKLILWYMFYTVPLCLLFAWLFNRSVFCERVKNFFTKIDVQINESDAFLIIILMAFLILSEQNFLSLVFIASILLMFFVCQEKEIAIFSWSVTVYTFSIPFNYVGKYFPFIATENFFAILIIGAAIFFCSVKNFSDVLAKLYPFVIAAVFSLIILNVLEISLVRGHSISSKFLFLPYIFAALSLKFFPLDKDKDYSTKIIYGGLILIVFSFTPNFSDHGYIDFFEFSNHGLTLQQLLTHQGLPVIDNLDAHMLFFALGGLIYFFLTDDYIGSIIAPYTVMIMIILGVPSFFYLLKKFLNERQAFLILTLFPFGLQFVDMIYIFPGFIVVAAFVFWKKNPTFFRSLILQILISFLCLYRIDLGVSAGGALFLCPILFCIVHNQKKFLVQYILSSILWVSLFFGTVYGIGFKFWEEFVTAFNSNQHWGYGALGQISCVYAIYFITPIFIAILFLPLLQRILKRQDEENDWIIILLYFSFILGISRMLVRHTLIEPLVSTVMPEIFLLAFLAICFCKRYKGAVFVGILLFLVTICAQTKYDSLISILRIEPQIFNFVNLKQVNPSFSYFMKEDTEQIELSKKFFDENLKSDETYFDFTNQSLFFAFTSRKNPIYINQCPAMINGVKGQLQALSEIKNSKVKFVVMPYLQRQNVPYSAYEGFDGILNCDRYYLLTEWIAKNYQPYKPVGNFFIWKEKDATPSQELNYNYDSATYHIHNLINIPCLWAKSSIQSTDTKISMAENNLWDLKNFSGKVGFITLEITSPAEFDTQIKITGKDISDIVYNFRLKAGTHLYRFRISSDTLWYSGKVEFLHTENLLVNQATFEELK